MSAVITEQTSDAEDQVTQSAHEEGGSPEVDERVDDIDAGLLEDVDLEESESTEDEAPPEESPDDSGEEPAKYAEQIEDLRSELAERDEIIGAIRDRMDRDPAFRKMLEGGSGTEPEAEDPVAHFQKAIRDGLTPEAATVIEDALSPVLEEITRLKGELKNVKPTMQRLARNVGSAQFQEALADSGVAPAVQRSRDFQKHLKRLRGKSDFQRLESRSPAFAADYAASKWQATKARVMGYKDERARVESAKGGRGGDVRARSSALAEKVVRIKRDSGTGHVDRAAAVRLKAEMEGKPMPKIEYYD